VVHALQIVQFRNWGKHAVRVAAKKYDVPGVASDGRGLRSGNVLKRVGAPGVRGDGRVVVVDLSVDRVVKVDVLEDRAESDGVEDLGFFARIESRTLRVAASLDVEDSFVAA
jgi:hypothetical protein